MSVRYKVLWAGTAEEDLNNLILYIAEDSPRLARTVLDRIKAKAASLIQLPERGRTVPELQNQGIFLYREFIAAPWRIIYRVSDNKVIILSVLDSRQNVEDMLLKRLIRSSSQEET